MYYTIDDFISILYDVKDEEKITQTSDWRK